MVASYFEELEREGPWERAPGTHDALCGMAHTVYELPEDCGSLFRENMFYVFELCF